MCPMLAVTNTAVNALAMGAATLFVLTGSSLPRLGCCAGGSPSPVRISTYIIIIATFVTVADMTCSWPSCPTLHKELGAFIALIVVNCLILGRQEAFASRNTVGRAVADATGMALGFAFALFCLGAVREVLGNGSIFNVSLFGPRFEPWVVMILPPGGFLMLGLLLLFFNWMKERRATRGAS